MKLSGWMRTTTTILLLLLLHASSQGKDETTNGCETSTTNILWKERDFWLEWQKQSLSTLKDDLPPLRTYVLCPDSSIPIGRPLFENDISNIEFEDGEAPIVIFQPNFRIQCGLDGSSKNNCTLYGNVDEPERPFVLGYPITSGSVVDATHFAMQGITFVGATGRVIELDEIPGQNVSIQDCIFKDNQDLVIQLRTNQECLEIGCDYDYPLNVSISDCIFEKNIGNEGIIESSGDEYVSITNTMFLSNKVTGVDVSNDFFLHSWLTTRMLATNPFPIKILAPHIICFPNSFRMLVF